MQIRPDTTQNATLSIYTQQMERMQAERARETTVSESQQDRVHLSDEGRLMAEAARVAHNAPDVREDYVAQLKTRVDSGSYTVEDTALAAAIVRDDLSL